MLKSFILLKNIISSKCDTGKMLILIVFSFLICQDHKKTKL